MVEFLGQRNLRQLFIFLEGFVLVPEKQGLPALLKFSERFTMLAFMVQKLESSPVALRTGSTDVHVFYV